MPGVHDFELVRTCMPEFLWKVGRAHRFSEHCRAGAGQLLLNSGDVRGDAKGVDPAHVAGNLSQFVSTVTEQYRYDSMVAECSGNTL